MESVCNELTEREAEIAAERLELLADVKKIARAILAQKLSNNPRYNRWVT